MGRRGPLPKSAEQRAYEGNPSGRPLPASRQQYPEGAPERPRGMTAAVRRVWDAYIQQMSPLGILRMVDVFALERLCIDVAQLRQLQLGMRQLVAKRKREAKAAGEKGGDALASFAMTHEGRRLTATMNALASRISRQEQQFGLTPAAGQRFEAGGILPSLREGGQMDPIEEALCGDD
jgi:hypothetical protein